MGSLNCFKRRRWCHAHVTVCRTDRIKKGAWWTLILCYFFLLLSFFAFGFLFSLFKSLRRINPFFFLTVHIQQFDLVLFANFIAIRRTLAIVSQPHVAKPIKYNNRIEKIRVRWIANKCDIVGWLQHTSFVLPDKLKYTIPYPIPSINRIVYR